MIPVKRWGSSESCVQSFVNATKDFLGGFHGTGTVGRFPVADLVGTGCDHSDHHRIVVGSVSQRLVLGCLDLFTGASAVGYLGYKICEIRPLREFQRTALRTDTSGLPGGRPTCTVGYPETTWRSLRVMASAIRKLSDSR